MNPLIFTNAFASVHIGVQECFCGKPTVEDHDFCFCSPGCARADSLRTLGGQGDYHYRNVMQRACASPAVPQHALSRHKSEHQLRSVSISKRASALQQSSRSPKPVKTLPTLEEGTTTIVPQQPFEPRNESVDTQQSDPPQRTLKRSLPSKPGLNKGIRNSIFAMFRKKIQQTVPPSTKIRRESSVTGAILQEMEEEEAEEEAAWGRLQDRMEDSSRPPTLVHHQARQTTDTRRSRVIRRSASFAGWNGDRGSVMEVVSQLRQAWNEMTDIMPDFDEGSDEEY
ncbi:uncharacterized protein HD556DRAFT_1446232 [Suillus plorans]|uniref:Uncharacterized protein n=1 Tax=Suillus plorans TaxID=116603 RepID=A0A9P7AIP9_9AGAM|nr:uncharacterized protein HD556DRAFT_1446232 [Suillus plorans]KAG1790299.1 hypothetical protein HD556DRAFT_1446232 [Suillus plorans]